jgi:hypothetical protein
MPIDHRGKLLVRLELVVEREVLPGATAKVSLWRTMSAA